MSTAPAQTGIHLETSYFWMAFLLAFFKPKVSIDGSQPVPGVWGDNWFPVGPGAHRVEVWFDYLFFGRCGKAQLVVDVPAGAVLPVTYRAPTWFVFSAGKMAIEGAAPGQPVATAPAAPVAAATAAPPAPQAASPQWDPQRNAWVQYDATTQAWLQFDDATQQWGPLR